MKIKFLEDTEIAGIVYKKGKVKNFPPAIAKTLTRGDKPKAVKGGLKVKPKRKPTAKKTNKEQ